MNKIRRWIKRTPVFALAILAAWMLCHMPVQAATHVKEAEYEGNGKMEVNFTSKVRYKNLKVQVKDGKTSKKVKILKKDKDELEFRIAGYKPGKTYTFKITGVYKKGEKKASTLTGSIMIPKTHGAVPIAEINYNVKENKVEFEFAKKVQYKSVKVRITEGKKNYVRNISEKDRSELEVKMKKLTKGKIYQYSIRGIKKKGSGKFGTITGSFRVQ